MNKYIPRDNDIGNKWDECDEFGRTTKLVSLTSDVPPDSSGIG